jgi:hypothetical protein
MDRYAHCREAYADAEAILAHLDNVGEVLAEMLLISDRLRLEIHGPAAELEKLSGPLSELNPDFYAMEFGFRS